MALPGASKHATLLVAASCGVVLAAGGTLAHAATSPASTFSNCGKYKVDSKNGGAKFSKGTSGAVRLTDVRITAEGCDMEIKANTVTTTSLDMNDSDWTLDGNVRIRSEQEQSKLSSDKAVVQFRNSEVLRITMTGSPAEFEQKRPDSGLITRGHAKQMVYEASAGVVRLVEDAWISDGGKEIKTPQLVYDIRKAEIRSTGSEDGGKSSGGSTSSGGNGDRVIITIDPKASKTPKKDDEPKPAPTPPPKP